MTLFELSDQYLDQADRLYARIKELKKQYPALPDNQRPAMIYRINMLSTMMREARDIGTLCRHYYEKEYHRNGKYSL